MSKWKEETVPSLIRLGTIPPSTSRYIRGKPTLNHVNVENNNSRVSAGSISKDEEEGAGARPCSLRPGAPRPHRGGGRILIFFGSENFARGAPFARFKHLNKSYFWLAKIYVRKWKEKTVPSLIRLGTIPPSTSRYIRGKPILNYINVENNNSRVSLGGVSKEGEEGAGASPPR